MEQELKRLVKLLWMAHRYGTEAEVKKANDDLIKFYYDYPEYWGE